MRLFIGMLTPDAVDAAVDAVLDARYRARAAAAGVADRWVEGPDRHLTLRFLGRVEDPEPATRAIARAAASLAAPALAIGPAAHMLTTRVLVLPVAGAAPAAAAVDRELEADAAAPPRRFTGHLTVARTGRPRPGERRIVPPHPDLDVRWRPDAIQLIASEPDARPRYRVIASHPFGG